MEFVKSITGKKEQYAKFEDEKSPRGDYESQNVYFENDD